MIIIIIIIIIYNQEPITDIILSLLILFLLLTLASRGSKIHVFLAEKIFFERGHLFLRAETFLVRFLVFDRTVYEPIYYNV